MTKYSIVDITTYDTLEEAVAAAEKRWSNLTDEEKAKRESFDILSHDGDVFNFIYADVAKTYKE